MNNIFNFNKPVIGNSSYLSPALADARFLIEVLARILNGRKTGQFLSKIGHS